MKIWLMTAAGWENTMFRLPSPLKTVGLEVSCGKREHRLTPEEFLEVE